MGEQENSNGNSDANANSIALVMITIDRSKHGKTNYLAETMRNLGSAGVEWTGLFLSTPECAHYKTFTRWFDAIDIPTACRSACENAGAALIAGGRQALERNLSWVLFCEDDLDFCDDFIGSVSRWLDDYGASEDYRLFAFGAAYPQIADAALKSPAGSAWVYPYKAFYGTQCFAIRPDDAISLGSYIASNPLIRGVVNPNAYDLMFHDWMSANYPGGAFLASVPSFVQHIGRQSICTGKEITHTFESWPGHEWSYRGRAEKTEQWADSTEQFLDLIDATATLADRKPRVLFVGDSPTVSTGFSLCTRQVCAHLHSLGWDVHVLGLSYFGDPHSYPYPIYPCVNALDNSRDVYGCERLPKLINAIRPDIVVLLNDPWNVEAYLFNIDRYERVNGVKLRDSFKLIGWLAVDGCNASAHDFNHTLTKPDKTTKYGQLDYLVVWTQFAADELIRGGWDGPTPTIIPLAVDGTVFKLVDKQLARQRTLPEKIRSLNPFVIGVVGRNQYRKRLDLAIAYFAEWIKRNHIDDAYLYLHCAPTGDKGVDIRSLVKYHGIAGRVILTETCLGVGIDERDMAVVYSSFDLLMTMTQGEGFGLTTLEAMSCGCATMGPDWSGLGKRGGWTNGAMIQIPCTSTALTAPIGGNMYTIGGIADREQAIATLDVMYRDRHLLEGFARAGKELASTLTWDRTVTMFEEMLRKALGESEGESESNVSRKVEASA